MAPPGRVPKTAAVKIPTTTVNSPQPPLTLRGGGITVPVPVDARLYRLNAMRAGLAPQHVPEVVAGEAIEQWVKVEQSLGALPPRTPLEARIAFLRHLRTHPELQAKLADSNWNFAKYNFPTFVLMSLAVFPIGDALHMLGLHDADTHFAAVVLAAHPLGIVADRATQVAVNRITGRAVGGVLVDFVAVEEAEGIIKTTIIPRGNLPANVWKAITYRLLPEGNAAVKLLHVGKKTITTVAHAPFNMAPGIGFADMVDGSMSLVSGDKWKNWEHRGKVKGVAFFVPDGVNALTRGAVTKFLTTKLVGRVLLKAFKVDAALFVLNLTSWGVNRWKNGKDAPAVGDRAAEIADNVSHTRPLLKGMRDIGVGKDVLDMMAAGEMPFLSRTVDVIDSFRVWAGLGMNEYETTAAIREATEEQRALRAKIESNEFYVGIHEELVTGDLLGDATQVRPGRLLEALKDGWLREVRIPRYLKEYDPRYEAVYDIIRDLHRLRTDSARARSTAELFNEKFLNSSRQSPLTAGTEILKWSTDERDFHGMETGKERILRERKVAFHKILIENFLKMKRHGITAGDLKLAADALERPDELKQIPPEVRTPETEAAADMRAAYDVVAWAREHGYVNEDGEIVASREYYTALGEMARDIADGAGATQKETLREWTADNAIQLSLPNIPTDKRKRLAAEIALLGPEQLFGEGSLEADMLRQVVLAEDVLVGTGLTNKEKLKKVYQLGPIASATYSTSRKYLDSARKALALDIEARTVALFGGIRPFMGVWQQMGIASKQTLEALSVRARRDADTAAVKRLTTAAADTELAQAYQEGGQACANIYGGGCDRSRSIGSELKRVNGSLDSTACTAGGPDLAISDVPAMLRRAVALDPPLAEKYGIDPETGAFTSAEALQKFVEDELEAHQRDNEDVIILTDTVGVFRRGRTSLTDPFAQTPAYQQAKMPEIGAASEQLVKVLHEFAKAATAAGKTTTGARNELMATWIEQSPWFARLVQRYKVLHAQARISKHDFISPDAFDANGRVNDWAEIDRWAAPKPTHEWHPIDPLTFEAIKAMAPQFPGNPKSAPWPKLFAGTAANDNTPATHAPTTCLTHTSGSKK